MEEELLTLLSEVRRAGVDIWTEEGILKCRAPKGGLDESLRNRINAVRVELIEILGQVSDSSAVSTSFPEVSSERDCFPLSHSQKMYWDIHFIPGVRASRVNGLSFFRHSGKLDAEKLKSAVRCLVSTHEILRTVFFQQGVRGSVQQRVISCSDVDFENLLARAICFDGYHDEDDFRGKIDQEKQEFFELQRLPLFKVRSYFTNNGDTVVAILAHRLVSDSESLVSLSESFKSVVSGSAVVSNQPLGYQYKHFALWQSDLPGKPVNQTPLIPTGASTSLQFGCPGAWSYIPHDLHSEVSTGGGRSALLKIPIDLFDSVIEAVSSMRISSYAYVLALFQMFLSRYLDHEQVGLYIAHSARVNPNIEKMIGCFMRTIKVSVKLSEGYEASSHAVCVHDSLSVLNDHIDHFDNSINDHMVSYSSTSDTKIPITFLIREFRSRMSVDLPAGRAIFRPSTIDSGFVVTWIRYLDSMVMAIDFRSDKYSDSLVESFQMKFLEFLRSTM